MTSRSKLFDVKIAANPPRRHDAQRALLSWARHIIPNAIGTVLVNAPFQVADAILAVAALSFLGFGVPPPAANWGGMLSAGVNFIFADDWWLIYPAGVAIVLTVVAFNRVGDGLRDAFEVRQRLR